MTTTPGSGPRSLSRAARSGLASVVTGVPRVGQALSFTGVVPGRDPSRGRTQARGTPRRMPQLTTWSRRLGPAALVTSLPCGRRAERRGRPAATGIGPGRAPAGGRPGGGQHVLDREAQLPHGHLAGRRGAEAVEAEDPPLGPHPALPAERRRRPHREPPPARPPGGP